MEFDFRLPVQAVGFSSGWLRDLGFSLNRQPAFSNRVALKMAPYAESLFLPIGCGMTADLVPPFMLKTSGSDGLPALSSGGGSAVFKWGSKFFKLKRCGLADRGFANEDFFSSSLFLRDGELIERSNYSFGGATSLAAAITENCMAASAVDAGLCTAYIPLGVYALVAAPECPFVDVDLGASLFEIESDLRVDELLCMALSSATVRMVIASQFKIVIPQRYAWVNEIPLWRMSVELQPIESIFIAIGRASGGLYRKVHDAGFFRGIGSSWFGNEVVTANGRLSVVDFDGGWAARETVPEPLATRMMGLEIESYCAETFTFLSDMRPIPFKFLATSYIDSFRDGYEEGADPFIDPQIVNCVIADHLENIDEVSLVYRFV